MRRPQDAAAAHILMQSEYDSEVSAEYTFKVLSSFYASLGAAIMRAGKERNETSEELFKSVGSHQAILGSALRIGETAFISEDMANLATIAANDLSGSIDLKMLTLKDGVLFFEKSLRSKDIHGTPFYIDAVAWRTMGSSSFIYWFVDNKKHPVEAAEMPEFHIGESSLAQSNTHRTRSSLNDWRNPNEVVVKEIAEMSYHLCHFSIVTNGDAVTGEDHTGIRQYRKLLVTMNEAEYRELVDQHVPLEPGVTIEEHLKRLADSLMYPLVSVWYSIQLMMGDTIANVVSEKPTRGVRRAMERRQMRPAVTTILLRKKAYRPHEDGEGTGRHLIHRHIVRGYWRRNPNNPQCDECKCQYVPPHFRGPEDGLLYVSNKVNAIIR